LNLNVITPFLLSESSFAYFFLELRYNISRFTNAILQLQRKKREEIMVTEETMETMGEEVEINLDRT